MSWSRPTPRRRARCCWAAPICCIIETVFDTLNAKAALFAVQRCSTSSARELPLIISGTITDASGRTLSGQTTEAFWNSIRHARAARGRASTARSGAHAAATLHRRSCRAIADTYVCAYPNAGLPNAFGEYDETPAGDRGDPARLRRRRGCVNIVGGCCGTTPRAHPPDARGGAAQSARARCRSMPVKCRLSGLEPLNIGADIAVRQRRRAHQRHRLGEVPQADRGGRLRRARSTSRASRCRAARR